MRGRPFRDVDPIAVAIWAIILGLFSCTLGFGVAIWIARAAYGG